MPTSPCHPVRPRGLPRLAAASAMLAAALGGDLLVRAAAAPAMAAERTPLAVVTLDGYTDLRRQFTWLGGQIGQPALAGVLESVLLMASQGRGLAGLDVKRPLGAVVTTDGTDVAVHGYIPVKSLDKLLEALQGVTGPVERSGNVRSIAVPGGMAVDIIERDGWAIVAPQGSDAEAVDPAVLFGPLTENYSIGVELFPSRIPEPLRMQLRFLAAQAAATAGDQGAALDPRAIAAAIDGLGDTESLALGLTIDPEKARVFVENRTVAVAGSAAAAAMQGSDEGRSTVPLPPAADGGRHAVRGHLVQPVPEARRTEAQAMLDQVLPRGSGDAVTQTLAALLREVIDSVLATGGIDAAVCADTSKPPEAAARLPAVTAGVRIRDGAVVEAGVKRAFGPEGEAAKLLPPGVAVAFDAARVDATNLHTVRIDLTGTDAEEMFGTSLELSLAMAPDRAYLLAGGDPRERLAAVLAKEPQADDKAKPIVGVDVAVDRMLRFAAVQASPDGGQAGDGRTDDEAAANGGTVQLLIRPVERGVATRLSIDGAGLRAAAGAAAATGTGGGPVLPLPDGFPIPLPAR